MTDIAGPADKRAVYDELEAAAANFHLLLDSMSPEDMRCPTGGTKWNNGELLFHMLFGYMITVRLIWIVKLFCLLPPSFSRVFAALLNALTGPFNAVNYLGAVHGAKAYNRNRMGRKFDTTCALLRRELAAESDRSLRCGMSFPARWDPFFKKRMTLADVYHYPTQHFMFHSQQLSADSRSNGDRHTSIPAADERPPPGCKQRPGSSLSREYDADSMRVAAAPRTWRPGPPCHDASTGRLPHRRSG
jgi:hypothetical protein